MNDPFEGFTGVTPVAKPTAPANDPFAGFEGVQTTPSDPFAGFEGVQPVSGKPNDPVLGFADKMADPNERARVQRLAKSWGMQETDPAVQARLTEPMGFRTYTTLSQLAATGDTDEANGLDKNGKPTGLGLRAALTQFGHAGGAFRRRDAAITSRIAAGQELEVGDTRPFNQQIATGMAGMPVPNMRTFKKIEDMSRAEQDASVPKDVLDVVNQYDSPNAPLDAKTRAQKIYDLAQASAMSREQVKRDAAEELAIREELTGKSDGLVNTIGNLAAKGMPTVGYGNSFLVGSWVLGGAVSGMDKASELLAADIDPETGKVLKAGDTYGEARLKGYGYGAFEGLSEVYTGKILGTALKGLDKVTGGYVGKTLSKGLDKAAQGLAKTSIGRGIAEFGKGVQRMAGLSALDNPAVEILGEEAEQQWAETAFAQRASDTTAPIYVKNVFNEATGQIEQVPVKPGSEEEATAKRQIAHYGDKSEYSQAGARQLTVGEKTKQYANDFYTWDNMGTMAEGFALQYALTLGGGAIHAIKNKDTRQAIDRALLMSGANNADLVRMSDEQKAEAFEKYYGSKENQAEFAEVFKDAGEQLSDMAQRMQDARIWVQTGNSLKPNFQTDLAKTLAAGTPAVDDEASGLTVSQTVSPEGTPAIIVQDRDGVLNPVTVASVAEAQKAAERMSQMKQGREADMRNRAAIATRVAQTFAPGRKLVLVQNDKDMLPAAEAAYAEEGSPFDPAQVKSSAKGATTPKGQTIIVNVAAATGVPDLVETIGHETGHSAFTQAGLTRLMQGKGASHLADEFQKAGVIAKGAEAKALFLSDVAKLKDSYASQGVKLNEAAAVEEVLANMNQGMTPVMRKRFGDGLVSLFDKIRGKTAQGPQTIQDARAIVAGILHGNKSPDVRLFGGESAWAPQPAAFTGDPLAEEGEKAAAPAPAEAPAPAPVEAPAPAAEPVAPAPQAQEEVKPVAPKEKKVFNSEEDFIAYASEHEDEVKDWTQDVDFEIKPQTEKEAQNAVQKPGLTLEGGTAADIEADKAKVEAQQQKQKEREEIEEKAAAPIKGDLGEMTAVLPGMEDTDEIPLLNQPKAKPKAEEPSADAAPFEVEGLKFNGTQRLPGMPDQQVWSDNKTGTTFFMPAGATKAEVEEHAVESRAKFEAAKPAAVVPSAVAPKNAEVEFERPVLKDQYAEIPGVSVGGKRTYLEKKRGSLKTYRVSDQHEGKVLNGMAVLLRTKGKSYQIEGIRIVGGGAMPAGSENWTTTGWEAYNRGLAKDHEERQAKKKPETPAPAPKAEVPAPTKPEPKAEPAKPPRMKFASQADFESYVLANPDKLEELERVGHEIEQAEAPAENPAEAAPAPVEAKKPEFVPPLKGLTEAPQIYKRRVEKLRKEWEAAQAEQPAEAPKEEAPVAPKEAEEIEEARMNAETQARVRAIPAKEYATAPALAAMKAELPAYEARKASKIRTADSMERQAYSTPPPLAAIGAEAAQDAATIVEPTAGNGGLLAPLALNVLMPNAPIKWTRNTLIGETKRARILANELDTGRADRLGKFLAESMNVTDPVFSGDYASAKYQTAVSDAKSDGKRAFLMNPPFGGADESGYKLEHRIALKTIESAVPGDTLFFIGGAPSRDAMKLPTGVLAGLYTSGAFAKFHEELNRQGWAPSLHFIVDGALYKKMGAAYPVEVLLMEKTATPGQHRPMRDLPARYSTWDQILAAVENMYNPGAETTPELLALDLTATPEREEAKRAEANTFAESLPKALQNEREKESGGTAEAPRYRLDRDIELGMVTPQTDTKVSPAFMGIYRKAWDQAFTGKVFNPSQLAERIVSMPPDIGAAYIKVADAIADYLKAQPGNVFSVSPDYSSMGIPLREAFKAKWDAARPTTVELEEGKAQVPYSTMSGVDVVSPMMVPRDLGMAVSVANGNFLDRHPEGVDEYVAAKMGWSMTQVTDGRLDGSQLDTLAMAIEKIDAGSGYIVGSQTGAGKGRIMAAIMAYHLKNGRMPVFLTAKANLFTAMWEDIKAIGEEKLFKPLVTNNYKAPSVDENDPDAEDADGFLMPQFFTPVQRNAALSEGKMPKTATALFLTYSQVQTNNQKKIDLISRILSNGGALVMDEAHLAAGADSNTGVILRQLADLPKAGVVFSSATFAKRGENMTLYKRAGYSQFFENDQQMEEVLAAGGVPFQQFLAARLTEQGYYIRHELDYTGIVFEKILTTDTLGTPAERTVLANREEQIADVYNQVIRTVMRFAGAVKRVNSRLQKGAPSAHMDGEAFMSSLHNTASFIYTALKAETVAKAAVKALREGRAPVISLYNTNQALLEEIGEGNKADVGRYLMRIAERSIALQTPDGNSVSILTPEGHDYLVSIVKEADAEMLVNAAHALMEQAKSAAEYLREQNLPASPIDRVKDIVEEAGFKFAELTGRSLAVDKYGVIVSRKRPSADDVVYGFNNSVTEDGKPNTVVLLNSAGATGLSIHNSPKFKNQATREMFVLQPAWDINEMMQMFGRVNRKDQLTKPIYHLMFTSAAGEQRNAAILMQKLRSLSANTSGVSKAGYGESAEDALDFMNTFGDKALAELEKEKNPTVALINDLRQSSTIRRATSISQFLPVADQAEFIAQIQARVAALQEHARESGAHDLEAGDIGRVPLAEEHLSMSGAMRAYEVPVTGKAKILTAGEAIAQAKEWQEKHPELLETALAKIEKAKKATENPWLHRIYGITAQTLKKAVDSIGQVYRSDATATSERSHFIPVAIYLPPSGTAQTVSDWRVKVSFNNIRGTTTLPLSIFHTRLLAPASYSYDYVYNQNLTRKEDRTLITGDIAKALIGSIDAAGMTGGGVPRIVRATPSDGNFSSFVLMMPRGISVANAKKIASTKRVPLTDIRETPLDMSGRPKPVEIDAGRVRVHAILSTMSKGQIVGAFFEFRAAMPLKAKTKDMSIASIIRATGLSLLGTAPNKAGYIEGSPVDVERANKILADLAKLDPALQATRLVSDEASVGGQATTAEAPRYRFAPVASKTDSIERMPDIKLRRYLVSSLGYGEAEVAGMGRQEMLRIALNADSDPYFQSPHYRLSEPVQVGELRSQSELERLAPEDTFPILEHLRGGSKIMVPYLFKGGEYDWLKEMGGVSAFNLAEREGFFIRPGEGEKRTKGNIDSIAKELGYDDVNEFSDAFLAEWQKSRDLYAVEKARRDVRRGALDAAREMFKGVKDKSLIGAVMGKAIDEVAHTLPTDQKADLAQLGLTEGEEAVRDWILTRHFERVLQSMADLYSYEGRDDTPPPILEDKGTFARPEPINKEGKRAKTFQQTKARLEVIAGILYAPNPAGVAAITDADAAAWVRTLVDQQGADFARDAARDMVAQRVSGQRTASLTKYETALMLWYQTDLDARTRETDARAREEIASNNISGLTRLDLERDILTNETLEYLEAARKYGSAAGQALQALKLRVDRGFNIVKIYRQAVKDNGDIALTPEQYAKLRDRVARLEKAWNDYVDAKGMTEEDKDLEARVGALEAEIADLTGTETGLKADIGAIEAKRNELELQRAELATGLGALSERKARIEADIARVESEIAFRVSLAQEVETLQKRLDALNAKLAALDAEYASVDNDRLAALEAEIAKLEAEYGKKQADYEKASAALKVAEERLARIRKLMEKLAKNSKAKIQRRREVQQHASNLYGVFKAEMEKVQLEQMADRWRGANPLGKVWIGVGMTRNVIRALQSMGDASIAGRQLAKLGLGHPILWAKAFAESLKLMFSLVGPTDANGRLLTLAERSDRALFEMDQMLREHPLWQVLRKGGLDWIDLTADPSSFDEQQVPVSAFLRAYLPKWTGVGTATTLLDISNNHYAGMSNMLRFYVAAQLYEKMQVANGGMAPSEADVRAIVTTVDIFGGRGDITTDRARSAIKVMNNILYSPRLAVANVQFYGRFVGIAGNWSYSRKARQMIAMEYLRALGMYAAFSVLARLISKMFSDDPNQERFQFNLGHTAFGQFLFGQNRIDITGGSALWARYGAAVFGGSDRVSTETGLVRGERPKFDPNPIWRLFRSKAEPVIGASLDILTGETYNRQAAGPRATSDQPGYSSRYRNILGDIMPIPLTAQTVASLIKGDAEQGIEPMRNPLVLLPTIGLEMLGVLSSSLPVNSQLAQEVEAGYTRNAKKLEKLEREQKDILRDKKMSPDLKEIRAGLIQTKIDAVRGTP